jgi:hypothetical protein
MDPLTKAYLKIIEESTPGVVDSDIQINKTFGKKENEKNTSPAIGGPEEVEGVEKPEEADEHLSVSGEPSELKGEESLTLKKEAKNPFDALYSKILSEDAFDFSTEDNTLTPESDFGGPDGIGGSSEDLGGEMGEEGEEESFEEGEEESLEDIVSQLRDLLGKLEAHVGLEEGEEESLEDMDEFPEDSREEGSDESSEEGEEDLSEESVEAEELGHALVDQEKLEAGLTKKTSNCVKGAVPVTKKSATVEKGKKVTGKPENHSTEGGVSKLTGKDNKVTAVQVGKELFNQG